MIVYVYGEPASQTVVDRWGGSRALFHRALANEGYVVLSFDNRGTPAPKGAAWRKVVYGTVGDLSSKEQAAAVRAFAASHALHRSRSHRRVGLERRRLEHVERDVPFSRRLQGRRLGRAGARPAALRHDLPGTLHGPAAGQREGYRVGSPINFADGLKGKLLVVHGSGDDNVHYQGTERLVNRLVELDKPFDLMAYPNRTHAISEGPGTSLHVHTLIARYFLDHLPAGPRPQWRLYRIMQRNEQRDARRRVAGHDKERRNQASGDPALCLRLLLPSCCRPSAGCNALYCAATGTTAAPLRRDPGRPAIPRSASCPFRGRR